MDQPYSTRCRQGLPADWRATLIARDGDVINDVHHQLARLPGDATHLVVSIGGNDVLGAIPILQMAVETVGDGLLLLAEARDGFDADYRALVRAIRDRGLPTALCTIYHPWFPDEALQRQAVAGLGLFNDCIVRVAHEYQFPVLDLRLLCTGARLRKRDRAVVKRVAPRSHRAICQIAPRARLRVATVGPVPVIAT